MYKILALLFLCQPALAQNSWFAQGVGQVNGSTITIRCLKADGVTYQDCNSSSSGGGGTSVSTPVAVYNGSNVQVSSPTYIINFSSNTMNVSLMGNATAWVELKPSSVTLQGNGISFQQLSTSTGSLQTQIQSINVTTPTFMTTGTTAGGDLSGFYPNPTLGPVVIGTATFTSTESFSSNVIVVGTMTFGGHLTFTNCISSGTSVTTQICLTDGGTTGLPGANVVDNAVIAGNSNISTASYSAVIGGQNNAAEGNRAVVLGGSGNLVTGLGSVAGGGNNAKVLGGNSVELGGVSNIINAGRAGILGGGTNNINAINSAVVASQVSTINGQNAAIIGGISDTTNSNYSAIIAGQTNTNNGVGSVILGGVNNYTGGDGSIAIGNASSTTFQGSLAFSDNTGTGVTVSTQNGAGLLYTNGYDFITLSGNNVSYTTMTWRSGILSVDTVTLRTNGQINMGWEIITNNCGAGVTTCTATCSAGKQATGCGNCTVAAVGGLSVDTGGSSTSSSCTCTSLTATTITSVVYCARIN